LNNAAQDLKVNRFEGLQSSQVDRDREMKALKDEYEGSLAGLEGQHLLKKQQQAAFLKKRLEMKRIAREKELLAAGQSPTEAKNIALEEEKVNLIIEEDSMKRKLSEDLSQQQGKIEVALKSNLGALKDRLNQSALALESGMTVARDRGRKALKDRLAKRKEARVQQLVAGGMNEQEARESASSELDGEGEKELNNLELEVGRSEGALAEEIAQTLEERSKVFETDYNRDLELIPKRLESEREALGQALLSKLESGMLERMAELAEGGMSVGDAEIQAFNEKDNALKDGKEAIEKTLISKDKEMREKLKARFASDLADIKKLEAHARKVLEHGLETHRLKDQERLRKAIEKKRASREAELIAKGSTPEEAKIISDAEVEKVTRKALVKLNNEVDRAGRLVKESVKAIHERGVAEIRAEHEHNIKGLDAYLDYKKNDANKRLKDRLAKAKMQRERALQVTGFTEKEAGEIAQGELGESSAEMQEGLEKIADGISSEGNDMRERAVEGLAREKKSIEESEREVAGRDDKESIELLDDMLEREKQLLLSHYGAANTILEAARNASKFSQEGAGKDLRVSIKRAGFE
jgi:hypothetical protein